MRRGSINTYSLEKEQENEMSDKEVVSITLGKGEKFLYAFETPRGSLVKCTVTAGRGKVVFMEDGKKVATYNLSLSPGEAYYVSLNTDRSPYYSSKYELIVEGKGSKKSEKNAFLLELPLGKTQQSGRKYITERKVKKQPAKKS
jgi:hypothetical protein